MSSWPFFEDPGQIIIPGPVYALLALVLITVVAFRAPSASRIRRLRYVLLLLTAWSWIALMPRTYLAGLNAWESRFSVPGEQQLAAGTGLPILVLGASDILPADNGDGYRAIMNGESWARTEAAVGLWRDTGGVLHFSGGLPGPGAQTTARVMADAAIALGAEPTSVTVEGASQDTWQNLSAFAAENPGSEFWLVTSATHMQRAVLSARRLGLRPLPYPCNFRGYDPGSRGWLPHNSVAHDWAPLLHEWVGIAYYRLLGRT